MSASEPFPSFDGCGVLAAAQPLRRPQGAVTPAHPRAARALEAIERGHTKAARAHLDALPAEESLDGAWRILLSGLLALQQSELEPARELLLRAASLAPVWTTAGGPTDLSAALRLSARALESVGWIFRRQDHPEQAYRAHLAAFHARCEHGSIEEVWESAVSLGLDADLARRYDVAQNWYHQAIAQAATASQEPHRRQAVAWAHLASSHVEAGQFLEAVSAARTARDCWRRHDPGCLAAALADVKLGYALLKLGQSQYESDPGDARAVLVEAVQWLTTSREGLRAFGASQMADVQWCDEQLDFAARLLAGLPSPGQSEP